MFMRIDKLQVGLPKNTKPDTAAAVQELMGGRFGEMSTLNNYMHQSFNMRGREAILPFYDLVASITAEEFGHVELVAATINLLQNGGEPDHAEPKDSPTATARTAFATSSSTTATARLSPMPRLLRSVETMSSAGQPRLRQATQLFLRVCRAHG